MSSVKFQLNRSGVGELLKSQPMQALVTKAGNQVANAAGKDYESVTSVKPTRAIATVMPNTVSAHFDNLKHNVLLRALGGG